MRYVIGVVCLLNLLSLCVYWIDKRRAGSGRQRISEARLLQFSFFGPVGSVAGIWWVRHKTKKLSYLIRYFAVVLASCLLHAGIIWWLTRSNSG